MKTQSFHITSSCRDSGAKGSEHLQRRNKNKKLRDTLFENFGTNMRKKSYACFEFRNSRIHTWSVYLGILTSLTIEGEMRSTLPFFFGVVFAQIWDIKSGLQRYEIKKTWKKDNSFCEFVLNKCICLHLNDPRKIMGVPDVPTLPCAGRKYSQRCVLPKLKSIFEMCQYTT